MQFVVRQCLTKQQTEAMHFYGARNRVLHMVAQHYGGNFQDAMSAAKWREEVKPWHKDSRFPDGWEAWPYDHRPGVLYITVEVDDAITGA